jgi:hypothetical protein
MEPHADEPRVGKAKLMCRPNANDGLNLLLLPEICHCQVSRVRPTQENRR